MVDVNKPVTNPDLVKALELMREENTPGNQSRVLNEVMRAHFLAPVTITPVPKAEGEDGKAVLKEKTTIQFALLTDSGGQAFFPAFTDWEELGKWSREENRQTLILTFDDYAAMILDEEATAQGFVINPYGDSLPLNRSFVESLRDQKAQKMQQGSEGEGRVQPIMIEKDTTVQLGQPSEYPKELVQALCAHFKKRKAVSAAYLQLMIRNGERSYLVVVDFKGERRAVFDEIAAVATPHLNGMYIDLIPLDSEFGQSAVQGVEPFYKKKKFFR